MNPTIPRQIILQVHKAIREKSQETLNCLSQNESPLIRLCVAQNPNAPSWVVLSIILKDRHLWKKAEAKSAIDNYIKIAQKGN